MHSRTASGFILPLALVLSSGLLLLAMLAWNWETASLPRHEASLLRERARSALLLNLPACVQALEREMLDSPATSALLAEVIEEPVIFRPVRLDPESGESLPLHSVGPEAGRRSIHFKSPVSEIALFADFIPINREEGPVNQYLAWAAEDISLMGPDSPPPEFWPLPSWDLVPKSTGISMTEFMNEVAQGTWQSLEWVPFSDPLPLTEESSPALVPVVRSLGLRFGIFAAGRASNHEKTIRVRFFIEGELWNPYNRPLAIHPGSGMRSALRVIFYNLPEVRIHNRSLGLSSEWLLLDNAHNSRSGSAGLHGYVRLPGSLDPGESLAFIEPDPDRQPHGLARTLLTGFMVRAADRIEIEIRQPAGGLYSACLPMEPGDPLENALNGHGWFRGEAYESAWPDLVFDRADAGPRPFLLEGGSLSFRINNAHLRVVLKSNVADYPYKMDPRRKRVSRNESYQGADGEWVTGAGLISLKVERINGPFIRNSPQEPAALFSWPDKEPESLIEAMDLPQWENGYRFGTADAFALNRYLDKPGPPVSTTGPDEPVRLFPENGPPLPYSRAFPVNQLSEAAWMRRLSLSGQATADGRLRFPVYAHSDPTTDEHFRTWPMTGLEQAVRNWVALIKMAPFLSPAAMFNSGILGNGLPANPATDPLHPFMPLRGWLRKSPLPRGHGAAWILHFASRAESGHQRLEASGRAWLLESPGPDGVPGFDLIRFEWTDPRQHLRISPP
jgi:hypothetical protein